MLFKIGDIVTRNSYNNDTIFKIVSIDGALIYLKGVNVRLYADSPASDLKLVDKNETDFEYFIVLHLSLVCLYCTQ